MSSPGWRDRLGAPQSAGCDSNPAQSHETTGLAVARYVFAAVQPIGLGGADVRRGASGFYT